MTSAQIQKLRKRVGVGAFVIYYVCLPKQSPQVLKPTAYWGVAEYHLLMGSRELNCWVFFWLCTYKLLLLLNKLSYLNLWVVFQPIFSPLSRGNDRVTWWAPGVQPSSTTSGRYNFMQQACKTQSQDAIHNPALRVDQSSSSKHK